MQISKTKASMALRILSFALAILFFPSIHAFAYHFDWIEYSSTNNPIYSTILTQDGELNFTKPSFVQHQIPEGEIPYRVSPHIFSTTFGIFRLDNGDSLRSISEIQFRNVFNVESYDVKNIEGDITFRELMGFSIWDLNQNIYLYNSSYSRIIEHTLGSTESSSILWEHTFAFEPDKEYVFELYYGIDAFVLNEFRSMVDWELDESVTANVLWDGSLSYCSSTHNPVPEPSTLILLGAGLGGLALYHRKQKRQA